MQVDLTSKDSQIANLQENIKSQQDETSKAKDELKGALTAIGEEAVFQALTQINWATIDFQPLGGEEEVEPTPEDPSTSRQPSEEA